MSEKSYSSRYLKIYFWQAISLILNFLSMFMVVLYLTKDPSTYGVYTVCISVSIFLAYSDLGFVGAGQKYAAEYFSRNEREAEIKVIGFTAFILFLFVAIFGLIFLYLGFHPHILLKNLNTLAKVSIASKLLIILACSAPITVLQRISQLIFSIRLEDYVTQRLFCIANAIKIVSILYFFGNKRYQIVEYYLFCQVITALAYVVFLFIAYYRYKYNFRLLFASFRFDKQIYKRVNKLAFSSLFTTISWLLYYELDTVVIGKFLGVDKVALYAIGLTMLSLFRSIFGVIFSPFSIRFNHFIGNADIDGLKKFLILVIKLTIPLVLFPIIALVITTKAFILSWVGVNYSSSVILAQILILCNIFAFISYPTGMLLVAQEKVKEMYFINALIPIVYWVGIIIMYQFLGLSSFAVFTFVAFSITAIYYTFYLLKFLNISFIQLVKTTLKPCIIPLAFLVLILLGVNNFLPIDKSKLNLLIVMSATGVCVLITLFVQYIFSAEIRTIAKGVLVNLKRNN